MSNKIIYYLSECQPGDTILLNVSAFCYDGFQIDIIGEPDTSMQKLYLSVKKETASEEHKIACEIFKYEGEPNFRLEISKDESFESNMIYSDVAGAILNKQAGLAGYVYNVFVEDNDADGSDFDYNDIVISLTAWRSGG